MLKCFINNFGCPNFFKYSLCGVNKDVSCFVNQTALQLNVVFGFVWTQHKLQLDYSLLHSVGSLWKNQSVTLWSHHITQSVYVIYDMEMQLEIQSFK